MGTNKWKEADDWPLRKQWTPFYLHEGELLSELNIGPMRPRSHMGLSMAPWSCGLLFPANSRGYGVIGPIVLNLYASTTDDEVLWLVSLRRPTRRKGKSAHARLAERHAP
jgi:hypothetical protein